MREYTSNEMNQFCQDNGIIHQITAPYSPQSNGVAERKNRTLLDMVNSMILSSGVSQNLWGEALLSACFILNRIPFKDKNETPYEIWKCHKSNLNYFRVWGCLAKLGMLEPKIKKIGPKTVDAIFVGYSLDSNTYRFLVINFEISEITNNRLIESSVSAVRRNDLVSRAPQCGDVSNYYLP